MTRSMDMIAGTKNHKAPGTDGLPVEIFKETNWEIAAVFQEPIANPFDLNLINEKINYKLKLQQNISVTST